jgi:hypothetical protein
MGLSGLLRTDIIDFETRCISTLQYPFPSVDALQSPLVGQRMNSTVIS